MRKSLRFAAATAALCSGFAAHAAIGFIENPVDGPASGVSVISGWHCSASRVEIELDGAARLLAGSGTDRLDTLPVCGRRDTGFGLLYSWALLAPGPHTIRAFADGVEFASRTVNVVSLGGEFLTGKSATVTVNEFPSEGRATVLQWREPLQGFAVVEVRSAPSLSGTWNGANLERRTQCAAAQNNGERGTYAQWVVNLDTVGDTIRIQENGITGLSCTYTGPYRLAGNRIEWYDGVYSCTDGKTGTFRSTLVEVSATAFSIRLATKLSGSETCDIDAILGGSRF